MEQLKQHISQLSHFWGFLQELKSLVVAFSAIPLFLGILMQLIKLTEIGALSFFSWTQVINDSTSIGWLFFIYAIVVAALASWIPEKKRNLYFHLWMVIVMGPLFVYFLWALLDFWDVAVSTFFRSLRAFSFIFCTSLALYFLGKMYREIRYKFRQFSLLRDEMMDWNTPGDARPDMERITMMHIIARMAILSILSIYYTAFACLSGFFIYDYFSRHFLTYFVVENQVYLANYYNDKYIFSVWEDRATLVVPIAQVKKNITARASTTVFDGFQVTPINNIRREMLWLSGSVKTYPNSSYRYSQDE